ncbi:GIY-YIG nuclease family protein [Sphingomonas sp. NIBR02145]|uniref:GIY-YIG nuclease family protein n=1 Tax=Sphingomonas sp. NIBR02145 TaxID=3014784 RepID=UPI0022B4C3F4|nr:GIY-YIG nuclease family protein [Sphingomonas sp. NIBR02145]WHU04275.1 GIY-YIG nuclease family protein [Sphingomonas sp. NIBR02145]
MDELGEMAAGSRHVGRNPDWTRDETILLMDLYLLTPRAEKGHPEVQALSHILRAAGRRDGRTMLASFRNPAGVAMRLRNFAKHDPEAPPGRNAGLRPGGAIDRLVWEEFTQDRAALAVEVSRIRRAISAGDWVAQRKSSRGPAPVFSTRTVQPVDGPCWVYLLLVDGPAAVLAPHIVPRETHAVFKIGRTSDVDRRMAELGHGLPPGAGIRYVPLCLKPAPSAQVAHVEERRLLDLCDRMGWSLGGEFAYAPLHALRLAMSNGDMAV